MDRHRRRLLQAALVGGLTQTVGCGDRVEVSPVQRAELRSGANLRSVLILGGTGFVGPYVVRRAIERGYEVTLFNRGRSNVDLFPDLELLVGDRNGQLGAIEEQIRNGRYWGAVVDLSGYEAGNVRDSVRLLEPATDQYVFISSVAAYESFERANDEGSPTHSSNSSEYGPQKARAEREILAAMPGRSTNIRPTFIAGPGDDTDRFTYWPARASLGGEMLVPGPPDRAIQFIDVRDVANFTIHCVEAAVVGNYNAVIPAGSYTIADLIEDSRAASAAVVDPVWVSPEFVREQGLEADERLPIWTSPIGSRASFPFVSGVLAAANGLVTREPLETVRDTLSWWRESPSRNAPGTRAGLSLEVERQLLAEWRARGAAR